MDSTNDRMRTSASGSDCAGSKSGSASSPSTMTSPQTASASSRRRPSAPPRSVSQRSSGHRGSDSEALTAMDPPTAVNRLRGWLAATGTRPVSSGSRPVTSAGTASGVDGDTDVVLRNHVASPATRAKFGYSSASMVPSAASRLRVASSSNVRKTTWASVSALPSVSGERSAHATSATGDNPTNQPPSTTANPASTSPAVPTASDRRRGRRQPSAGEKRGDDRDEVRPG